jgi:glycosyltransferase involved in cell wall biosynthesis
MAERVHAEVLVFIPAFDEAETVADVVRAMRAELPEADVLVVDDGSTDETAQRAREAGASVGTLPFNLGIGAAIQTGYLYALRHGYRFCAHLDADGQHRPEDVRKLLEAVESGACDLAIGSRYHTPPTDELLAGEGPSHYAPTFLRRIGISLFRGALSFVTRHRFTDTTSGLRAANRQAIALFASEYAGDYPELESLHSLVRHGLSFEEIPVVMLPRAGGRSKFNPINSAFFIFKGLLVLFVGVLRRPQSRLTGREHEGGSSE